MLQGWHDLASMHWPFDPDVVQRVLPADLRVDTCEGSAWVGIIPFHMQRIRVPGLPALGPLSTFPETNVRTYVVAPDGRRAVWFCSLDITRLVPALVARVTYRLPYCWSKMSIEREPGVDGELITYTSRRRWPRSHATGGAESRMAIRVGTRVPPVEVDELQVFLTARWALGTTFGRRLMWAEVEHPPWPVYRAELVSCDETMLVAAGLPAPTGEPVVLWSPGVEVRISRPRSVRP